MKIELKKLQVFERMSEETTAFVADVYINGKKVGTAKNDGHGGETHLDFLFREDYSSPLVRDAVDYLKTLPPDVSEYDGHRFEIPITFHYFVDHLVDVYLKLKETKKKEKLYTIGFVYGKPNGYSYRYVTYIGKPTLERIKNKPGGLQFLQKEVDRIKSKMEEGETFLNEEHLKSIGLNV